MEDGRPQPSSSSRSNIDGQISSPSPSFAIHLIVRRLALWPYVAPRAAAFGTTDKGKQSSHLKSLFGKGLLLGRRTFFRPKKVRSIALLNLEFTVVRFVSSVIPLAPFMIKGRHIVITHNFGLELGLWLSLGYISQALGMLTSIAGCASFLSLFTELLSIIGLGMLEYSGSPPCVGDILNFFSGAFFGIHMLQTEHISRRTDRKKFLPLLGFEVLVVSVSSTPWFFLGISTDVAQGSTTLSWSWAIFLS
ncbi:hypothetical protein MLD38_007538 [Melastoma candidum]|uniref:Uncharacterized protein n=1 Tax=Melastoma candidum TaxID=119954 RepID=A0ACB9RV71_9MYRT|nr:hypothetical protein MLD38_007538 [Melastoma candidum]